MDIDGAEVVEAEEEQHYQEQDEESSSSSSSSSILDPRVREEEEEVDESEEELRPPPKHTARHARQYRAAHQQLERDKDFENRDAERVVHALKAIQQQRAQLHKVGHGTEEIDHATIQMIDMRLDIAIRRAIAAFNRNMTLRDQVLQKHREGHMQAVDTLLNRPAILAQSRPLHVPGTPLQVPVDTWTNGEPVIDEQSLWKGYGLSLNVT